MIAETHTRLGDHLNPDSKLLQYDPDAMASSDLTPWLPWQLYQTNKEAWTGRLDGLSRFISQVFDPAQVPWKGMESSRSTNRQLSVAP